jgi:pantoate--beta-alanine ligase
MSMRTISTVAEMRTFTRDVHARGRSLALVPTMGALHEGHFCLVRNAKKQCDVVVVSIFVNPSQFDSRDDLKRYPRDLEKDLELLRPFNIDAVFAPGADEIYPEPFTTYVDPGEISKPLEGACRPGHFRGVATVVLKLLNIVRPNVTYFGQKDFQQALVIRRLVEDLNLDLRLVISPIVRDADGLAISSRNAFLSAEERRAALALSRSLKQAEQFAQSGEADAQVLRAEIEKVFAAEPRVTLEYAALVDPVKLEPVERVTPGCVALLAARVGKARLIDNLIFGPPGTSPEMLLQLALTARPVVDTGALIPGFKTEAVRRGIEACRECAAYSSILMPPREFLSQYISTQYPDLNAPQGAVIGRDAPRNPDNYLYRDPEASNRFTRGLFELLGVKDFSEFKTRFVLTDTIRCHGMGPHIPVKALGYCSVHLREELKLFPNLRMFVVLGDDAYWQFQRFMLERNEREIRPFEELLADQGWATEQAPAPALGERILRVYYCYHPTYGYKRSPSIAAMLA